MNQQKIGAFLKELRCDQKMTQAQLAEHLNVSNKTISRWETGVNMPDLDLVLVLADFYKVEIAEVLNGERNASTQLVNTEATVRTIAQLSSEEKEKLTRKMHVISLVGLFSMAMYFVVLFFVPTENALTDFLSGFALGMALGVVILSTIFTSKYQATIIGFKMRVFRKVSNQFSCCFK